MFVFTSVVDGEQGENIINIELDMPNRMTQDCESPTHCGCPVHIVIPVHRCLYLHVLLMVCRERTSST